VPVCSFRLQVPPSMESGRSEGTGEAKGLHALQYCHAVPGIKGKSVEVLLIGLRAFR